MVEVAPMALVDAARDEPALDPPALEEPELAALLAITDDDRGAEVAPDTAPEVEDEDVVDGVPASVSSGAGLGQPPRTSARMKQFQDRIMSFTSIKSTAHRPTLRLLDWIHQSAARPCRAQRHQPQPARVDPVRTLP